MTLCAELLFENRLTSLVSFNFCIEFGIIMLEMMGLRYRLYNFSVYNHRTASIDLFRLGNLRLDYYTLLLILSHYKFISIPMIQGNQNPSKQVSSKDSQQSNHTPTLPIITQKPDHLAKDIKTNQLSQQEKLIQILCKENRNPKEKKQFYTYILEHPFFSYLVEKVSMDLIKIIFSKTKDIIHLKEGTVIAKEGDKISFVTIVLFGKMAKIVKNKNIKNVEDEMEDAFQKLGLIANSETREVNRQKKLKPNSINQQAPVRPCYKMISELGYRLEQINQNESLCYDNGIMDLIFSQKFTETSYLKADSWVIRIPKTDFLLQYNQVIQKKIEDLSSKICTIPCFGELEKDKLETIILSLGSRKKYRGAQIYKEGDIASSLYFLTKGQVKIMKKSKLFEENPNQLYANRLFLMLEDDLTLNKKNRAQYQIRQLQQKKAQARLPYANLTSMYNYQPKVKNIEIGSIGQFCLFGEEDLLYKKTDVKKRQTTAICESIDVIYYEISLKKLLQILGKGSDRFVKKLKKHGASKIIRRQDQYAHIINLENSRNMNYFYDSDKIEGSGNKFRISKVNKKILDSRNTIDTSELPKKNKSNQETKKPTPSLFSTAPMYTSFNFHKLKQQSKMLLPEPEQNPELKEKPSKNSMKKDKLPKVHDKNESDSEYDIAQRPNNQQMKIYDVSHTWKLMKKRVNDQLVKSARISPVKYQLGVQQPLIGNDFLQNSDIQKRKVERMIRKQKITLVNPVKSPQSKVKATEKGLIQSK